MSVQTDDSLKKSSTLLINIISIAIPIVVAGLLGLPTKLDFGDWTRQVPHLIGVINTVTSVTLILGFVFIKMQRIQLHRAMMTVSFGLGALFLVFYVIYHLTNPANRFTGQGFVRYVYFFTLITHVGLSFFVLPLVLRAMFFAVTGQISSHRRIARWAFPTWLYVSVTGVLVYLFVYWFFPAS